MCRDVSRHDNGRRGVGFDPPVTRRPQRFPSVLACVALPAGVILRPLADFAPVGGQMGGTHAVLSIEVQLHAGDLGQADRQTRGSPKGRSVGGKLHGFWYAFGTHDGFTLWEAPDNVSMAAVALAISGGGALSSLETTVLLTVDETMEALRKAEQVQYQAPGA